MNSCLWTALVMLTHAVQTTRVLDYFAMQPDASLCISDSRREM